MSKRAAVWASALVAVSLGAGGCGVSVSAGRENAATHPASGIWVARTVGSENISGSPTPTVAYNAPPSTLPEVLPSGLEAARSAVESAISGGCWEDSHEGNLFGAYDQLFWWQGHCSDTIAQVDVELYPTVTSAAGSADHSSPDALLGRYRDGAVLVDVYSNAPEAVLAELNGVSGLAPVPGYSS